MGLFDRKPSEENPDAKNASAKGNSAATVNDNEKAAEVRKMSGFENIGQVASAAPSSSMRETGTGSTRGRAASAKKTQAELDAAKKAELRQMALETAGKHILGKLASIPYDAWAAWAADDYMKLPADKAVELADSYYIIAQSFDVDFTKPWMLIAGCALMHVTLVADRLKHMAEKDDVPVEKKLIPVNKPN